MTTITSDRNGKSVVQAGNNGMGLDTHHDHTGRTIMIVDDEPGVRRVLDKRLRQWTLRVLSAASGRQAIELLATHRPDAVITDLFMPDGDGFELLHHIRDNHPDLPVIVLSGQGELGDAIQALRLGAWDYLYKPIENMSILLLAIERVLDKAALIAENRAHRERLEELVAAKSADLIAQQQALMERTASLEKANAALKALLEQRETEKSAIEQTMVTNLKRFVFPYLDDLQQHALPTDARTTVAIIRANIDQLITPLSKTLQGAYRDMTPAEIKVADLIRQGASTKAISAALHISPSTVEKHRNKIRKKLKLLNTRTHLYAYLNSLT